MGRAFLKGLSAEQQKVAIITATAPKEIITTNKKRAEALSPTGIAASALNASQKKQLAGLIKLYLARWRPQIADEEFAAIEKAGFDKVTFAWAGAIERGTANYYRVQGPGFLIEFDNSQNNANHIHTVFRDFKGDFGHDLLAEHYAAEHGK